MVVGYDSKQQRLTSTQYAIAGGLSSTCTRTIISPMDVVKIRLQLTAKANQSITATTLAIYKKDGFRSFWRGHVAAQMMGGFYGILQLPLFEFLTEYSSKNVFYNNTTGPAQSLICGGLAAGIVQLLAQPVDTVRVRMIAQIGVGQEKSYSGFVDAIKQTCKTNGLKDFWKGTTPALVQTVPYNAIVFTFVNFYGRFCDNSLIYGFLAGMTAKLIIYPIDVVKKRVQIQSKDFIHSGGNYKYSGVINCTRKIWKTEGYQSFYNGSTIAILKSGVTNALIFFTYKYFKNWISSVSGSDKFAQR